MTSEVNDPILIDMEDSPLNLWGIAYGTIEDDNLMEAIKKVDRAKFLPFEKRLNAYKNRVVNLGNGSSLSEPLLVFQMIEGLSLKNGDHVLEIGVGSGYTAAIMSQCGAWVDGIDYQSSLCDQAKVNLRQAGVSHVEIFCGDGALGLPKRAPFDAIVASAHLRSIPDTLINQLKEGGMLVAPVSKDPCASELIIGKKVGKRILTAKLVKNPVYFYKVMSSESGGWTEELLEKSRELKRKFMEYYYESLPPGELKELIERSKRDAAKQNFVWPENPDEEKRVIIESLVKTILINDTYYEDLD